MEDGGESYTMEGCARRDSAHFQHHTLSLNCISGLCPQNTLELTEE